MQQNRQHLVRWCCRPGFCVETDGERMGGPGEGASEREGSGRPCPQGFLGRGVGAEGGEAAGWDRVCAGGPGVDLRCAVMLGETRVSQSEEQASGSAFALSGEPTWSI